MGGAIAPNAPPPLDPPLQKTNENKMISVLCARDFVESVGCFDFYDHSATAGKPVQTTEPHSTPFRHVHKDLLISRGSTRDGPTMYSTAHLHSSSLRHLKIISDGNKLKILVDPPVSSPRHLPDSSPRELSPASTRFEPLIPITRPPRTKPGPGVIFLMQAPFHPN